MRKLILRDTYSLGDIVLLTAAVRDLHRCHPNRFITDVRTYYPELWLHNPWVQPLHETDPDVEILDCEVPLINRCTDTPVHALLGYLDFLNQRLGPDTHLLPASCHGDLHISPLEKSWFSQVHEITGEDTPFWIVAAGGKYDITIKWWSSQRYQSVVDYFRGRIQFVQVGDVGHHHPRLDGVIDLRGRTNLRQLVRLVYHAQGVLCGVTGLMHLAAAIETKGGHPHHRPCVVVAGGREPPHWESYPHHQFLHTVGALPCCAHGGCWRSRTLPLGDGDDRDNPQHLCLDVVGDLPRCMDMITPNDVIRRLELYLAGGVIRTLTPSEQRAAAQAIEAARPNPFDDAPLNVHNVRLAIDRAIPTLPPYPPDCRGRGIIICAGGATFFACAWVCIRMLRRWGCSLPVQVWHLGARELNPRMAAILEPWNVQCIDAELVRVRHPARQLGGWQLKPYALLHSSFQEVLLLDADNVPLVDPEFLFASAQFQETGAVLWPDFDQPDPPPAVWRFCGIPYRREPPVESGQVLVDKARCWRALALCSWFNDHSDFFYHHVHGDKETFHLAFRKLDQPYAMPATPMLKLEGAMCQHDFEGNRIFQHRFRDKWSLTHTNRSIPGFRHETTCRRYLRELRRLGTCLQPPTDPQ
jgi:ADP-heptose:LPS heptosyltransferase